jgi:hypothetical protein
MVAKVPGVLKKRGKSCPKCGSTDVVPIEYGYPGQEMMDAAAKGLIELGGCCVFGDDPRKHCKACGEQFDRPPASVRRPTDRSHKPAPRR